MEEEDDQHRAMKSKMNKAKKAKKKRAKARKEELEARKKLQEMEVAPPQPKEENDDDLEFEDPYGDEFEEEDIIEEEEIKDQDDNEMKMKNVYYAPTAKVENEELEFDMSAYGSLHQLKLDWPALSFDFFRDHMGQDRTRLPTSLWFVAGTQTDTGRGNQITLVRVSNIHRTKDEAAEDGMVIVEDVDEEGEATLEHRKIDHPDGNVNRVRAMPQEPGIVATWSDSGKVHLFDARKKLSTLNLPCSSSAHSQDTPVYSLTKHKEEGYAMDWSLCRTGRFATGDCAKEIYVWDVSPNGVQIEPQPFKGHGGSVEDLQWSPTEENVFASCSTDGSVKIWDVRAKNRAMLSQAAHDVDVNVISWNRKVSYLLASGSDDCSFKVWDLRQFSGSNKSDPVGWFHGFHTDSITSIEWSPHDESVIACTSADHQTSIWDLALEEDREYARQASDKGFSEDVLDENGKPVQFPPQLLFIHAGVRDPKEIHFHPQITGFTGVTGESGFDIFLCEPLDPKSQIA